MYDLHPFAQKFEELVENSIELSMLISGIMVDDEKQCITYDFDEMFTGMIFWDERDEMWRDMGDQSADAFSAQEIRQLQGVSFETIEEVAEYMLRELRYYDMVPRKYA